MDNACSRVAAWLSIFNMMAIEEANRFVTQNVINGDVNFKDKIWAEKMRARVIDSSRSNRIPVIHHSVMLRG